MIKVLHVKPQASAPGKKCRHRTHWHIIHQIPKDGKFEKETPNPFTFIVCGNQISEMTLVFVCSENGKIFLVWKVEIREKVWFGENVDWRERKKTWLFSLLLTFSIFNKIILNGHRIFIHLFFFFFPEKILQNLYMNRFQIPQTL